MTWASRSRNIALGDIVRYSAAWLRNTGQFTGGICFAKGKVTALDTKRDYTIATVDWGNDDIPARVNVANLERVRQAEPGTPG